MAFSATGFKWYDGFFLSMLVFSILMVFLSWDRYNQCELPLHFWIVIDYATIFVFRVLMFVDNGIAAGTELDLGLQLQGSRLCGRLLLLSFLYLVLYPFLWAWSIVGSIWFSSANNCLPEKNQKWGFLVWLLFSFCGLICLVGTFVKKLITRRQALVQRARHRARISVFGVLVDLIRRPDWVLQTATERRPADQDNPYPGMDLNDAQRAALEDMIIALPIYTLKAVPTDCSDCPICLEEFTVGTEVRGLPCAHNFHVACIDKWLQMNVKCPRCRCSVFPDLNLNDLSTTIPVDPSRSSVSTTPPSTSTPQPNSSYLMRMQSFLLPVRPQPPSATATASPTATSGSDAVVALEIVENTGVEPVG